MIRATIQIIISIFLIISCSCQIQQRKISFDVKTFSDKKLIVHILSNTENLFDVRNKIFLQSDKSKFENIGWNAEEYARKRIDNNLKSLFGEVSYLDDSKKIISGKYSFDQLIIESHKTTNHTADYHLFLVPKLYNKTDSSGMDYFGGCTSYLCFPVLLLYKSIELSYRYSNNLLHFLSDERKTKVSKEDAVFKFVLSNKNIKNDYPNAACRTGIDIILIENGQKKFAAYKKISYDSDVDLTGMDYNKLQTYSNFSGLEKQKIKESCLRSLSYSIDRGLYDIGFR